MPSKPKKRGPKVLPADQKRTKGMPIKFRPPERTLVDRAAEMDHDKPYNWGRRVLVTVAEHRLCGITLDEAYAAALAQKQPKK